MPYVKGMWYKWYSISGIVSEEKYLKNYLHIYHGCVTISKLLIEDKEDTL